MRFCIITLGCKVNQYESAAIEGILCERGHELVALGDGCDVCILNSCAVTAESVRKSRQAIRRLKKLEPAARIAVCGCFSQLEPDLVAELGVDLVGGSGNRRDFVLALEGGTRENNPRGGDNPHSGEGSVVISSEFEDLPPGNTSGRTRALLKIQDGCDNFCSYCVVPFARGRSRSLPLERVALYAKQLEERGYKEIIITGIEISSYGKGLHKTHEPSPFGLLDAIRTVSSAAPLVRLRLGSLDPAVLTDEFCQKLSEIPNLCNHFHLSLQSGCDATLERMGRKYRTCDIKKAITSLRMSFPDCGITADLIVGFPGETEIEFEQTLDFITQAKFSDMHIFPFSSRPGTRAADMPEQIEKTVKKERARIASVIADEMAMDFRRAQIGKVVDVLFEQEKNGYMVGYSGNYMEICVKDKVERNSIYPVIIKTVTSLFSIGVIE
ncbi:MAG: tRNA (N(6)-L-threonylcarbamoyladenosine(37)-C(2))-methylthiotransferase MtaB [Oscillospiraceae bacterium]|nr:tRNA (N(6)-L-threonylcarbamoyladenosine(37)-C(2))-methylthiotransferase MtaB [Oscillospiraceae bacterium]